MPDVRTLWRAMSPRHPLVNARREVAEHARITAEVDAVIARIEAAPSTRRAGRSRTAVATTDTDSDSNETLESSRRAS